MMTAREAFALGFAREAEGKLAEARAIYEQILRAIPEHPGALLKIAEAEHSEGHSVTALELLERATRSAAQMQLPASELWLAIGRIHSTRRDIVAAQAA